MRWRVSKDGYDPIEDAPNQGILHFSLVPRGTSLPGMVYVPNSSYELESEAHAVDLPEYWLDKYEITNREFKRFIDDAGYRTPRYWPQSFIKDGRWLSWQQAMTEFRDTTGRPGPSTWELGAYPDGQDDWPVSGVSWYEAAAYAAYAGKRLPTVYHWFNASGASGLFSEILRFSNFGSKGATRVGITGGLGPYGTYDMAGNVKEWCSNEANHGRRYILGGAWNEAQYQFHDEDAQPPFERRASFGFRCMVERHQPDAGLMKPILTLERDPNSLKPVSDEVYRVYRHLYDYDPVALDSKIEETDDSNPHWRRERVSFRAAYGAERVPAYLFLPRGTPAPYQTVVFFPGSDAVELPSSRDISLQFLEFIIRSGRAVVYPIYQQMYERHSNQPRTQSFLREFSIQRGQDVRRTLDYLETRPEIDRSRIAIYGLSLGAQLAPVYLAVEPRLRTGVLLSGGFETWQIPPEADPVNFTPHVKQPVLMVNGREDFDLPYATAQVPMFRMLGTPPPDKRHAVFEGGHLPPRPQEVYKEILDWLDRYLGPVGK
jgi:dienelactone hydrolase